MKYKMNNGCIFNYLIITGIGRTFIDRRLEYNGKDKYWFNTGNVSVPISKADHKKLTDLERLVEEQDDYE